MRSGDCTLQQTLTAEAASVLKHSLGLARRRGHTQVTSLHVAATLLSLRASPLRRACLQSQQPQQQLPLHCNALELCFSVALNRLPTTPAPLLHSQPSLSNALIAALKRAQAHQRRECIEQQQQQPLLTIKVELEQLIISILDDPSVSRVMREAGFSSTAVKTKIEDSSSSLGVSSVFQCYNSSGCGGVFSSPCSPSPSENHRESIINTNSSILRNPHFLASYSSDFAAPVLFSPHKKASSVYPITDSGSSKEDDIKVVLDVLLRKKKRNTVIVGDSVSLTEGLVGELMEKIGRGDVPDELKSIHFIKFQFLSDSLRFMKRDEVEKNLSELKRKVESIASEGAIFYVGDLKWTEVESERDDGEVSGYNPIEHLVAELGKMFGEEGNCKKNNNNNNKVWLMGTASYETYMRCQIRQPSLETQWALQAVPVPSGEHDLTLHASSVYDSKMSMSQNPSHTKLMKEQHDKLNCCEECASNYEKEAQWFKPEGLKKLLPSWLQSSTEAHQKDELAQLKRKWNRLCYFLHQSKQPQNNQNHWSNTLQNNSNAKIYPYNSSYPWWPNQNNVFFPDSSSISFAASAAKPAHGSKLVPRFRSQQSCTIEFNFSEVTQKKQGTNSTTTTNLDSLKGMEGNKEVMITLALGNSTFRGSGKTVDNITDTTIRRAHVCKMLQENVPWQSETLPSIAEGLVGLKPEKQCFTWFLLQGNDSVGKTRLALAIAESVFGSVDFVLHLDMKKLENSATPLSEIVAGSLKRNEKIVVLVEDVDFAEPQFKKLLADEFEALKFGNLSIKGGNNSAQAIFILTIGGSRSNNNEEQNNTDSVMRLVLKVSENKHNFESSLPCLGQKRRAELDLIGRTKIPRIEENEETMFVSEQWSNKKKDFSRQSSFNTLDLNMKADEEEEYDDDDGENSPISSDLTGEPIADNMNSNGFLDSIKNRFEFNTSPARDKEKEEMFLSKIKGSFEDAYGRKNNHVNFNVDERVIEEIGIGCGSFTNNMFEKWLKDIFHTSLLQRKVNKFGDGDYGKEGIVFITLCLGGKDDNRKMDSDGFMGSCLPKNIQVNYFMD